MGNIVLLDDLTINKIAAGEVIERPASVVKELVENSIDAGANNITVEIRNGGISYIRVTDNGKGIVPDDMEIAFERHATSKIRKAEDLNEVKSMGFRGEALASIAAIARVDMISRTAGTDIGYEIVVEGGKLINKEEMGAPVGTSITVENLFFNTPVRYKFLKKDFTESGYIEDMITRIALVNPQVAIKLINSGKTVIQTSGNGDLRAILYNIYGKDVAENVLDVEYIFEDMKVSGVIGKPVIARSNRSNQLFFVNHRYVKDKTLTSAAEQAFKGMITIGKYGFLVLNIEMDPHKVDVNVHPAKLEVRFEEEGKVFKAIYHAVKDALLKGDLISDTEEPMKEEGKINPLGTTFRGLVKEEVTPEIKKTDEKFNDVVTKLLQMQKMVKQAKGEDTTEIEEKLNEMSNQETEKATEDNEKVKEIERTEKLDELEKEAIPQETITVQIPEEKKQEEAVVFEEKKEVINPQKMDEIIKEIQEMPEKAMNHNPDFAKMYEKTFGTLPSTIEKMGNQEENSYSTEELKPITGKEISVFEDSTVYQKINYKFIGIAFKTYIIMEMQDDLYIIDQHAAHERIMYEKVKKNYYSEEGKDSQLMLLPDVITLTHKEMGIFSDNKEMFEKAGFMVEEFGENTIKLTGVPNICLDLDTKELFMETLDEINTVARTAKQEIEEKFIATVACKAAVKAHMALSTEEVDTLMQELLKLPNPFTCPHGRPTAIKMTKNDIEKKFSRR